MKMQPIALPKKMALGMSFALLLVLFSISSFANH
jgi:hypothetical protein